MLYLIVLCIIQAITEFLPVSSSAHLSVVNKIFGVSDPSYALKASLHLGTLLTTLIHFRAYFIHETKTFFTKPSTSSLWLLAVGSIPAVITGALASKFRIYESYTMISIFGIFGAILMYFADRFPQKNFDPTYKQVFTIGLFQSFAVLPGMSRMGMCLTGARFLSMERVNAVVLSFWLSVPVTAGALLLSLPKIIGTINLGTFLLMTVAETIIGLFVIRWVLKYLTNHTLLAFVIYRILFFTVILFL